ncbi:MAG TPA: hypothetical protein VGR22_02390 [Thermomicrobiales bacterium]|nr:hypothetical protein [Thermomicrobiales bacterium]
MQSLTAGLDPAEAARLREAMAEPAGQVDPAALSPAARTVYPLLTRLTIDEVESATDALPQALRDRLDALSPMAYLPNLRSPIIVLMHAHDDSVIPRTESLQLRDALADRPGLRYTEFIMFKHLDPSKVQMRILPLLRELGRFYLALYPMFRGGTG